MKLKAANTKLPLPKPFDSMWLKVNKIIDGLHLQNHVNSNCKTLYNPKKIIDMYPDLEGTKNTMACEQTFVWLGRFKKIMCNMPKAHHLFYLHRVIKRRNSYNVQMYKAGRKPLLPKLRNKHSQ